LHTVGIQGPRGYVVSVPTSGALAKAELPITSADFLAVWQLGMKGKATYILNIRGGFKFVSWVDTTPAVTAGQAVSYGAGAEAALKTSGAILDPTAGVSTAPTINAVRTGESRTLMVFGSGPSGSRTISLVEFEGTTDARTLSVGTFEVKTGVGLPSTTANLLGLGYNPDTLADGKARVVTGGDQKTYLFPYAPVSTGDRLDAPQEALGHPSGLGFLSAGPADGAGKFWVVGIRGGNVEIWPLDATTGYGSAPAFTGPLGGAIWVVPAFDAYDRNRLALALYQPGKTTVVLFNGLGSGGSPVSTETPLDFTSSTAAPPFVLLPGGDGYLVGRASGTSDQLYVFATGAPSAPTLAPAGVQFGVERHQALQAEVPDQPRVSISVKSGETGDVQLGGTANFTVSRDAAGSAPVDVTYVVEGEGAADVSSAVSGSVTIPAGQREENLAVAIKAASAIDGCKNVRSFSVRLTATNVTVLTGTANRTIAVSKGCDLSVSAPGGPITPGQSGTFTISRSGADRSVAFDVSYTVVPGANATAADVSPLAGTVMIPAGSASATVAIAATSQSSSCVPQKSFDLVVTNPRDGVARSATATIAAISTGCGVTVSVISPTEPFLPGDQIKLQASGATPTQLAQARWSVVENTPSNADWPYEWLDPSPSGTPAAGAIAVLRFKGVPSGGGTRTVHCVISIAGQPDRSGDLVIHLGTFADLLRVDGPTQVKSGDATPRRFSLVWLGNAARKSTGGVNAWYANKGLLWQTDNGSTTTPAACPPSGPDECTFFVPAGTRSVKVRAAWTNPIGGVLAVELPISSVAAPDTSQTTSKVRYVPVALEAAGVGLAVYETELTLVNRGAKTAAVDLEFLGRKVTDYVGGGRQLVINGLVERMREVENFSGRVSPVKVTFKNLAPNDDVEVLARTTTPTAADSIVKKQGRAGLAYRGLKTEELFGDPAGSPSRSAKAVLVGLRGTDKIPATSVDRSNLAIVNPELAAEVRVRVSLRSGSGAELFTEEKTLSSSAPFFQYSNLASLTSGQEVAYATVQWLSGGTFTAYATPLDNKSNDGSWVFPIAGDDTQQTVALIVPVVLEVPDPENPGKFRYLSDLSAATPLGSVPLKLDYYWQEGGQPATLASTVSGQTILGRSTTPGLPPGGLVKLLRDQGTGNRPGEGNLVGAMLVSRQDGVSFSRTALLAGTKVDGYATGDPAETYGRFGIFLPAVPIESLTNLAEISVLGLRNDAEVRSNLALINPGGNAVNLKIGVFNAVDPSQPAALKDGQCRSSAGVVQLAAHAFCQVNGILQNTEPALASGYVVLERVGADTTQPFLAYGVINDNPTNDGAYLPAFLKSCSDLQIAISPDTLPKGQKGQSYGPVSLSAATAGRGYTWTQTGLPAGLTLGRTNGLLGGTPTDDAPSPGASVTILATDRVGCSAQKTYSLVIDNCPAITIAPETLNPSDVPASQQTTWQLSVTGAGAQVDWAFDGNRPDWITFDPVVAGKLSANPPASAVNHAYSFTVKVTDRASGCSATKGYNISVKSCTPPEKPAAVAAPARPCGPQQLTLSVTNADTSGDTTYRWTGSEIIGGLSGASVQVTPSSAGTFTYRVTATKNNCDASSDDLTVIVDAAEPTPVISCVPAPCPAALCQDASLSLTGTAPPAGWSGQWTVTGTTGAFSSQTSAATTFTPAAGAGGIGSAALHWTLTKPAGSVCEDKVVDQSLTVREQPVAPGNRTIACLSPLATTLDQNGAGTGLAGNAPPTGATGTWTVACASGASCPSPLPDVSSPSSETATWTAPETYLDAYDVILTWTVGYADASCPSSVYDVRVAVRVPCAAHPE
jgi:hypothetical protein